MEHAKLIRIANKMKRLDVIGYIAGIVEILMLLLITVSILCIKSDSNIIIIAGIAMILAAMAIVVYGTAAIKMKKYQLATELYIENQVMTLIEQNGIGTNNFKIVKEFGTYYIAFHNQNVDYSALQEEIDELISELNKIAGCNMRYVLI